MKEPKIRFKGFSGEWKDLPFSEIAERTSSTGKTGSLPGIEFEDIVSGEGCLNKDVYQKDCRKYGKIFREGDILFGKLRPYLKNILLAEFRGIAIGDFWILRPCDNDSKFIYNLVNSEAFMRVANVSSGSKMPRADWNLVSSTMFLLPQDKVEQELIGKYFTSLDAQISASTSRLASLKQVKAACLQAMFPQEGETVPKIRFKGFEGEWKNVKFGILLKECTDKSTSEDEDILLSSAINGVFLNSELFGHQRGRSNIGYRKVRRNMLILSAQNLHLGNANVNLRFEHGLVSPAYKIYDLYNVLPEFMYHWIKREETKKFFLDATTAGASLCRKNIVWTDLYKQNILLPKRDTEQQSIASFFTSLDRQIALHTQRLEKLKQIKAACLDKMFV
ncbi:restriction endonuclease subunit S [Prevotellamassilia timonensis]|uniref:restriction endonuclease subunit S n=1 Tax=Prevotellamassilia timonensis TaxID=1852370 RepID=UPI003078A7C7